VTLKVFCGTCCITGWILSLFLCSESYESHALG
jgi:hypothetical protein